MKKLKAILSYFCAVMMLSSAVFAADLNIPEFQTKPLIERYPTELQQKIKALATQGYPAVTKLKKLSNGDIYLQDAYTLSSYLKWYCKSVSYVLQEDECGFQELAKKNGIVEYASSQLEPIRQILATDDQNFSKLKLVIEVSDLLNSEVQNGALAYFNGTLQDHSHFHFQSKDDIWKPVLDRIKGSAIEAKIEDLNENTFFDDNFKILILSNTLYKPKESLKFLFLYSSLVNVIDDKLKQFTNLPEDIQQYLKSDFNAKSKDYRYFMISCLDEQKKFEGIEFITPINTGIIVQNELPNMISSLFQ